ncbi:TlpA family protein disulfide reductase [Millisia brevis]|uniref:TlpA family protein disulfide reductase n=1 Tax=Millisia brevis TaxID=264148 RepID=UPI000B2E4239|nr:TlpA disulfide reductase family protein [Millisia brevis]
MKTAKPVLPVVAIVAVVVIVAVVGWMWTRPDAAPEAAPVADAPVSAELAAARATTAVAGCPVDPAATPTGPLAGLTVECLATGEPIDAGAVVAGTPTLINLWAYWCGPCAQELPILQQFAERANGAVSVVTVHRDLRPAAALARLDAYGVTLEGLQDPDARIATAVGAPEVLPVSVLLRPDGSVATVHAGVFRSVDEVAALVSAELGVSV